MKYLIAQDWVPTHGNHAGMVHMCELLCEKYPDSYRMLVKGIPNYPPKRNGFGGFVDLLFQKVGIENDSNPYNHYLNVVFQEEYINLCKPLLKELKEGDEVFLLEYLTYTAPQYGLAKYLKEKFPFVKLYALSHLTVSDLRNYCKFRKNVILEMSEPIDKMLTLGSSLSSYFSECGVNKAKIVTGFHYVDLEYYRCDSSLVVHKPLQLIAMGAMKRNYLLLSKIVRKTPDVNWVICRGLRKDYDYLFDGLTNVELKGFLPEEELKHQMEISDISVNVMEDTIGSNVITTSMSMGLAMIVSNVGSICDYCSTDNSIFCENNCNSFVNAINSLIECPELVLNMKQKSLSLSKQFSIDKVHEWFNNL